MRVLELGVLLMVGTTVTLGAGLAIFSFGMKPGIHRFFQLQIRQVLIDTDVEVR